MRSFLNVYTQLGDIFQRSGTIPINVFGLPLAWALDDGGAIRRYFAPHIVSRGGGYQLLGSVGAYVVDFEQSWDAAASQLDIDDPELMRPLISAFITNHPALIAPPIFGIERDGKAPQALWIQAILEVVADLPSELPQLVDNVVANKFGPFKLRPSQGHKVKWSAFIAWLRSNSFGVPNDDVDLSDSPKQWRELRDVFVDFYHNQS